MMAGSRAVPSRRNLSGKPPQTARNIARLLQGCWASQVEESSRPGDEGWRKETYVQSLSGKLGAPASYPKHCWGNITQHIFSHVFGQRASPVKLEPPRTVWGLGRTAHGARQERVRKARPPGLEFRRVMAEMLDRCVSRPGQKDVWPWSGPKT